MRKQYHFRPSAEGLRAWDVDKLVALAKGLEVQRIPLDRIRELDEPYWFGDGAAPSVPTRTIFLTDRREGAQRLVDSVNQIA